MHLGLSTIGRSLDPVDLTRTAQRAESLGYDSIWTAEAWGTDAFTPLAYVAANTTGCVSAPPSRRSGPGRRARRR